MQIDRIVTYAVLIIQILSTLCIVDVGASLPPLYNLDPHDVQHPALPPPQCTVRTEPGFEIGAGIQIITDFCTYKNEAVSATTRQTISSVYNVDTNTVRLTLSWSNRATCQRSYLQISPSQGSGETCKSIFYNILLECKACLSRLV